MTGFLRLLLVGAVVSAVPGCLDPKPTPQPQPTLTLPAPRPLPNPVTPPASRLPDPTTSVTGGGPLFGGGDAAAVARMNAQLPAVPQDYQLSGVDAISYVTKVQAVLPQLSTPFRLVSTAASCAIRYGVVGAKVYVTRDLTQAAAIAIVSRRGVEQLPSIAARCLVSEVFGGGPGALWDPCARRYYYDSVVNGVDDRYYVMVVGTNSASCDLIQSAHQRFNPVSY